MPILGDDMEQHRIGGTNYGFSAKRVDALGACEYTLVDLVVDRSGSVEGAERAIEACIKEIVKACRLSPRADNLMLRLCTFDNRLEEIHGFKPLSECNPDDYDDVVKPRATTALYDAAHNAIEAVTTYGKTLTDADFDVNAIVVVLTDGRDNASALTPGEVKKAHKRATAGEAIESLVSILVGVLSAEPGVGTALMRFSAEAGFTQYVEIEKADAKTMAKLARFVSKSVSAQSQALGTGGPSQALQF